MPELPEVEFGRRLAASILEGRILTTARVARDPIVFDGVGSVRIRRALVGRRVEAVHRRGKYIWFVLDARPWPVFHFGMTGAFRAKDVPPLQLESSPEHEPPQWPPRFTKLRLGTEDGGELAMTNARRLGRIRLRQDPPSEPPISKLGFDPLLALPGPRAFRDRLSRRTGSLKGVLLDQSFAAGVGNWIADEVLYQARLSPRRTVTSLRPEEIERMRRILRTVVRQAVRVNANKLRFPRGWLFHARWGRQPNARTHAGERVEFIRVAGRNTAWVPTRQV